MSWFAVEIANTAVPSTIQLSCLARGTLIQNLVSYNYITTIQATATSPDILSPTIIFIAWE